MTAKTLKNAYKQDVLESIDKVLDNLPEMPPERALSAREVVISKAEKIRERIDAGYTYQQIADALAEAGFKISVGTLKTYLSIAAKQPKAKTRKKPAQDSNAKVTFAAKQEAVKTQPPPRAAFQDPDEK